MKSVLHNWVTYVSLFLFFGVLNNDFSCAFSQNNQALTSKAEHIKYFSKGTINSCRLKEDFTINNYLLPKGSELFFNEQGNLDQCSLGKDAIFYGQQLPAHTTVFFNRWGHKFSFWLSEDAEIQKCFVAATSDGIGNSLYENGRLQAIWLAYDQEIQGVPCSTSNNVFRFGWSVMSLGTKRMVWFYDNGQIQQAMLSRDVVIQGHNYFKGEIISFDRQGKIDLDAKLVE